MTEPTSLLVEQAVTDLITGRLSTNRDPAEIFYGRLLAETPREYCTEADKGKSNYVPTAAVALNKSRTKLIVNLDFFARLTEVGRKAIVKHEGQHISHRHIVRWFKGREFRPDVQQANIAMDAVINQFNPEIVGLKFADGEEIGEVQYGKIPGAVANGTWEEYYDAQQKQKGPGGQGKGKGKGKNQGKGGSGAGSGDSPDYGNLVDDHRFFGEIDEETNMDIVDDIIKDQVQRIARTMYHGTMPQEIEQLVEEIRRETKVNWRTLLRHWMKESCLYKREQWILRESLAVEGLFPGYKNIPAPEFDVYADMSGSVDNDLALAFFAETLSVQSAMKAVVRLHQFDTKIHSSEKIDRQVPTIKRAACGGTNMRCIIEHAKANKVKNLVVMTDGYCPEEDWSGLRVLFVYSKQHQDHNVGRSIVLDD